MVSRQVECERLRSQDTMKKKKKVNNEEGEVKDNKQESVLRLHCNKGKACKFKRSFFGEEDDGASSAILLLACVFCAPKAV
ncbi:hypothetical protein AXF42_Ash000489 [Apostasia shenzhenica]|uniref:Uncharacterized protein n=1 Tax=Apostasia shenzhenica TaxID=1088818 RepID=A0A2I0AGI3_9ASPA|nr:hypothetical protein AXF42_Ash000489 [Apostasia shenzhenica]